MSGARDMPDAERAVVLSPAPASEGSSLRISVWLWYIPSSLFIAAVVLGGVVLGGETITLTWAAVALALVVIAAGVAGVSERRPPAPTLAPIVPLLLLVAAGVSHGAAQGRLDATILLAGLPVAWLAFEFGRGGTALAIGGVTAVGTAPYAWGTPWPTTTLDRWDQALPVAALIGMAVVTSQAGRLLRIVDARLHERSSALERESSTTRAIVESVDAAIAVFVSGEASHQNVKTIEMCRRAGVTRQEPGLSTRMDGSEVRGADRHTPVPPSAQALCRAQRGEVFSDLVQWVGSGKDQRAVVCGSSSIRDADGGVLGTVFVGWDATDVLDSVRVRDEFLGTVGHELRTPLTAIMGYLELQTEDDSLVSGSVEGYVDAAKRQAFALSDRIEALLAAALPRKIATSRLDVVPLTRAIVSSHREHAQRRGLELELEAPEELPVSVNEAAYSEIVENLVDNALKFTQDGSVRVTLRALDPAATDHNPQADNGGLVLEVEDTGLGMSMREAERVFDPFYRTETVTRQVVPGLGIGLAITKQLVHAHRGSITVLSEPDRGSRFRVTIPVSAGSAPALASHSAVAR